MKKRLQQMMNFLHAHVIAERFLFFEFVFLFFMLLIIFFTNVQFSLFAFLYHTIYAMIFTYLSLLFYQKKIQQIVCFFLVTSLTLLYLIQIIHYRAFTQFALLYRLNNLKDLIGVADNIFEFISIEYILLFIPLIGTIFFMKKLRLPIKGERSKYTLKMLLCTFFSLLILIFSNSSIIYIFHDNNKTVMNNVLGFVEDYGVTDMFIQDVYNKLSYSEEKNPLKLKLDELTQEEQLMIEEEFVLTQEKNNMSGIYKGKNLVFVTMESMSPFGIDKDLTPTLYKLKQEGIYFSNFYSPVLSTFGNEYIYFKGFPYVEERKTFRLTAEDSLPTLFKKQGYQAEAFHNFKDDFYSRKIKHVEMGFDEFYGMKALDLQPEKKFDFPKDEKLFDASYPIYSKNTPFFAYHLTVSGHASYDEKRRNTIQENLKKVREKYPKYDKTLQGYQAAQMLTDQGVAKLIQQLTDANQLKDTVIVLVGDHYPYGINQEIFTKTTNVEKTLDMYKVPFIVWDFSKPQREIKDVMRNYDVLPTLANLFDLPLMYSYGKDIFSKDKDKIMVEWFNQRNFSMLNNTGGYDGVLEQTYGSWSPKQKDEELQQSKRRLRIFDEATIKGYFERRKNNI